MPLPTNNAMSLQGHSKPGDVQYSKPKQAVIFRFPGDAMDRLEAFPNQPKMNVVFGDNPGFYIGEEFFPMKIDREAAAHELYLRSSLPNKPGPSSLKLYANITAKAIFVDRKLGEKIQSTVRERTEAAEKQRTGNKIKLLDAPPASVTTKSSAAKKHKDAMTVRRIPVVDAQRTLSVPSTTHPSRVASPRPAASSSRAADAGLKQRLIHFVALQPRTKEEAIRCVLGRDASAEAKQHFTELLIEVCERVPAPKGSGSAHVEKWQLRTASWLEVRPKMWPKLSSAERLLLMRHARSAFHALGIPETDPVWDNARPPETGGTNASGSGFSSEAKRPAVSSELRKSKPSESAARKKTSNIIVAKDEGSRAKAEKAATESNGSRPVLRRPGSGYVVNKSHTPPPPASDAAPKDSKRSGTTEINRETPVPSSSRSLHPPPPREERSVAASSSRVPKRERGSDTVSRIAESDRDSRGSPLPSPALKRKKIRDERDHEPGERDSSVPKRRKLEDGQSTRAPARELVLPKKPVAGVTTAMAPPKKKYKKEPSASPSLHASSPIGRSPLPPTHSPLPPTKSPLPPMDTDLPHKPAVRQDRVPSTSSSTAASRRSHEEHSRNGSAKLRRKSPIYTSSEDEGESQPRVTVKHEEDESPRPPKQPKPLVLPETTEGLRRLYRQKYPEYIALHYKREATCGRMMELLELPAPPEDPGVVSCDEDELEVVDDPIFRKLNDDYMDARKELQMISEAHAQLSIKKRKAKKALEEE